MKHRLGWRLLVVLAGFLMLAAGWTGLVKVAEASKTGGTLNISLDADPPKLDPSLSSALVDRMVFQSIFDKLVDLDANGKIVPMLAEKWEISSDQKTYIFKLRRGVKFHDGTDFNADAVKFNFERNMDKASTRRNELKNVSQVTVIDPYTVKVELEKPFAPFLSVLTDRAGMMASPEAVQKYGQDFMNHPVGTGPFVFKSRIKGSSITLERNPDYWQKGLPKLDKVVFKTINDLNVALMNLKSGEVDITNVFPHKEIDAAKNDPKIRVINKPGLGYQGMYLNTSRPPFDRKELRQAVDLLINREAIVKVVLNGAGSPAHSPFSPAHFTYGASDKYPKPDLKKARELLKAAGKPDGFSFTLLIGTNPVTQQTGQMIQNMLRPAGINVTLERLEFGTLLDRSQKGNFEASQIGWSGRPDPDQNIYDFFVTGGPQNDAMFSNAEVDQLLRDAREESNEAKRKAMYDKVLAILHEEAPYVYFYHSHNIFGISKAVKGFTYVPDGVIRTVNLSK